MPFRFYIDGQLTDQPDSDKQLQTSIKRDKLSNAILMTQDVRLVYSANNNPESGEISGYSYLKGLFEGNVCSEATVEIYNESEAGVTTLHYTGVIKVPVIEIDLQRTRLEVTVNDNSYYSYIKNNQNIKVDFTATESKNKVDITPLNEYTVDMFNGINGVYTFSLGFGYFGYRVYDVFRFIIAAITDNKVGFESTYLTSITELFIFKGQSLLYDNSSQFASPKPTFQISFAQLFREIDVEKNLAFMIDTTDPDAPVLRLENAEALFGASTGVSFTDIKEMKASISEDDIYSNVRVGSGFTVDGQSNWYTFNEATSYFGFKVETFHPLGQCNTDAEKNLVNDFVISNNAIQDVLVGGATNTIDEYFLVECQDIDDVSFQARAVQYNYFGASPQKYLYNMGLNNYNKLTRHATSFQTNLANFLGTGGEGFRALLGDDPLNNITYSNNPNGNYVPPTSGLTVSPAEFPNETTGGGYDAGGNYNNVAFEFTLPVDGDYSFGEHLYFMIAGIYRPSMWFTVTLRINHYDSGMVLKSSGEAQQTYFNDGIYAQDFAYGLTGVAGDIVQGAYRIQILGTFGGPGSQPIYQSLLLSWDSYFECNGTPDGGITMASSSANDVKVLNYDFEYDIDDTTHYTLVANPTGSVQFEKDGQTYTGWIASYTRNDQTGRTSVKLLTSHNLTTNALTP